MNRFRAHFVGALALCLLLTALSPATSARAQITPLGQKGCPAGSVVGGPNLIYNGDFSLGAVGFESDLLSRGPGIYPDDPQGGFSIQTGDVVYYGGQIVGRAFPGDTQRDTPPTQTYFYSNPNEDKQGNPGPFKGVLWRQTVTNLAPSTTYNFYGYFDNLLIPAITAPAPKIELRVDDVTAGPPVTIDASPDQWVPVQFSFTTGPGQTSAKLEIYDLAYSIAGDDFGMTQLALKQCAAAIGLAKYVTLPLKNLDGSYDLEYVLTVRNLSPDPLPMSNLQVRDDLAATFANAGSFQVLSLLSDSLTVNPNYDGKTDVNLLTGTDSLPSRVNKVIRLKVRVTAGAGQGGKGPFFNRAVASAQAANLAMEDNSSPGLDPDPNGNGDPGDPAEDVPTRTLLEPVVLYLPLLRR